MKKWIIIGIILLVVILVSVYFYKKSKKDSAKTSIGSISAQRIISSSRTGGGLCEKCVSRDSKGLCSQWMQVPCNDMGLTL
jgi:hypothetical protein